MPDRDTDPLRNYNFILEIDGLESAGFSEVTGLSFETDVVTYRAGNALNEIKLPGLTKVGDITLKRGLTRNLDLWDWYRTVLNGAVERRSAVIQILNDARETTLRFRLRDAWPRKYAGPVLNASGNDVAIEELVLVTERMEIEAD